MALGVLFALTLLGVGYGVRGAAGITWPRTWPGLSRVVGLWATDTAEAA
ncbi:MAG TPA: hypothetical protein VKV73_24955 [Chloroflexota bacterium]|nr:hypothetical protein [Chloroflexota bacterium]